MITQQELVFKLQREPLPATTIKGTALTIGSALGTPSSGTVTNLTGTANININGTVGNTTPSSGRFTSLGYAGIDTGGVVEQTTSRTTEVTINKISGAITLYGTTGSASVTVFKVNNNTVVDSDVIIVNQKSGNDSYIISVSNVSTGSFNICFFTTGATAEQPVFNFAVIKAVAA